jgi:hypothetical protein
MAVRDRPRHPPRTTRVVRLIALTSLVALAVAGCSETSKVERQPERPAVVVRLPASFERAPHPLTRLVEPRELYAASSFHLPRRARLGGGCIPAKALNFPGSARGALLMVSEYEHLSRRAFWTLPRRPRSLRLSWSNYGLHECMGDGFDFHFREHGRALIVQVWMDPEVVPPGLRRRTQRLVDGLRFPRSPTAPARTRPPSASHS